MTTPNSTPEPTGARLYVDEALCSAHGQCFAVAPSLFEPDDDGFNRAAGAGWVGLTDDQVALALTAERMVVIGRGRLISETSVAELASSRGIVLHDLATQAASLEEAFLALTDGSLQFRGTR